MILKINVCLRLKLIDKAEVFSYLKRMRNEGSVSTLNTTLNFTALVLSGHFGNKGIALN